MAEKIVTSIKEAEKAAKDIIEKRKKQNIAELEEAIADSKNRLHAMSSSKQRSIQEAAARADEDSKDEIGILRNEYDIKINGIGDVARKNLPESVKFIISNI